MKITLRVVLLMVAAVLFSIAAMAAGGDLHVDALAFAFGGFASWALSGAVP